MRYFKSIFIAACLGALAGAHGATNRSAQVTQKTSPKAQPKVTAPAVKIASAPTTGDTLTHLETQSPEGIDAPRGLFAMGSGPDAWKSALTTRIEAVKPEPQEASDLIAQALARLTEIQNLNQSPVAPELRIAYAQTCSLWVAAALEQLSVIELNREIKLEQNKRLKALQEINAIQEEQTQLERGYSTSLKSDLKATQADLEVQRREAQKARDEADKRFNELNSALIQVKKDARGTIISMSDILFDVGKATLKPELKTSLAKIAGILSVYKDGHVIVEGHTDNQGPADLNQKLSEKRAENVRAYLVKPGGIDSLRLSAAGYGFTKPVADNATKEGRQKNRRVDLIVSDKK